MGISLQVQRNYCGFHKIKLEKKERFIKKKIDLFLRVLTPRYPCPVVNSLTLMLENINTID